MTKPTPKTMQVFQWNDIEAYLQAQHGKDVRNWSGAEQDGQNFWFWLTKHYEVHNGKLFKLYARDHLFEGNLYKRKEVTTAMYAPWVMEVLTLLQTEFGDEFYVQTKW